MFQNLKLIQSYTATDKVRLCLRSLNAEISEVSGVLTGPHSLYARTLKADYQVQPEQDGDSEGTLAEIIVLEPCFWTPAIPMTYSLSLELRYQDGREQTTSGVIGLRPWSCDGVSFRSENRRIVLRGRCVTDASAEVLEEARELELALLVSGQASLFGLAAMKPLMGSGFPSQPTPKDSFDKALERDPGEQLCEMAAAIGVLLVLDLRNLQTAVSEQLLRLNWFPAVFAVLLDEEQLAEQQLADGEGRQCFVCEGMSAATSTAPSRGGAVDAFVVELEAGERPPEWVIGCGKPIVAVRSAEPSIALNSVRRECDRLQADLAPQFDLAGYFV